MAINLEEAIKAAKDSGGNISDIARKLGVTRQTVYNAQNKWATLRDAIHQERESNKDMAEGMLQRNIKKGDNTAIIFYLKTQAKDRGYVERQEITGKDGEPVAIKTIEVTKTYEPPE
jgi:hypothetical protein